MGLRQVGRGEEPRAADFLDERTTALRWLVALLRSGGDVLSAAPSGLSLWWLDAEERSNGSGSDRGGLLAWLPGRRTLYVGGRVAMELGAAELLCREVLAPSRVVGDFEILDGWRRASPELFHGASRISDLEVLAFRGQGPAPEGFRAGDWDDLDVLLEYEQLLYRELEDDAPTVVEALLDQGLVYVVERGERVQGMVYSNLSDGRFVHGGGVFVHPAYRGKGAGKALAEGLGCVIRDEEGAAAVLDSYGENAAALAAYRAAGYAPLGKGLVAWFPGSAWE